MVSLANLGLPEAGGPEAVGWLTLTLAALALAVDRILAVVRGFRRSPPLEAVFVTKNECGIHHQAMGGRVMSLEARMDRVERKMESDKVEIIAAVESRVFSINERVDIISNTLAAVDERSSSTNARLLQMDAKMDRILERIK